MKKILIADNHKAIQFLLSEELSEEGYQVIVTSQGGRVLGLIERNRPDLVIMEVKLGRYDGLDILQDIRNNYYNLPVILYADFQNFKHDPRAIAADYCLVKSSDLEELKLKIARAIESRVRRRMPARSDYRVLN